MNLEKSKLKIEAVKMTCDRVFQLSKVKRLKPPLPFPAIVYIIGLPSSGKTTLLIDLFHNKKNRKYYKLFDKIYFFSPSQGTLPYPFLIPEEQKFNEYNETQIKEVLEKMKTEDEDGTPIINCMIFDDLCMDINESKNSIMKKVIFNRRHKNIYGLFITSQRYNKLALKYRQSIPVIIAFPCDRKQQKAIYEDRVEGLMDEDCFYRLCDFVYDNPHNFLMINGAKFYKNFDRIKIT